MDIHDIRIGIVSLRIFQLSAGALPAFSCAIVERIKSKVSRLYTLMALTLALAEVSISSHPYVLIPVILFHPIFRYDPERT